MAMSMSRLALPLVLATAAVNGDSYFTGDGTAYTLGQTSAGNCNMMMTGYSGASTNYAAINNEQWNDLANCGRCAQVWCDDDKCSDKSTSAVVQILDRCPECKYGDLDLSPSVFKTITGSDPARYSIKWKFVDCPISGNLNYCLKSGSNAYWTAIQPANVLTGVSSLKINGASGTMLGSAYYYLLDGQSTTQTDLSAVTVTVTDVNGQTIQETVSLSDGVCTEGSKQFSASSGSSGTSYTAPSPTSAPATTTPTPTTAAPTAAPTPTTQTPVSTVAPESVSPTAAISTAAPVTYSPTDAPLSTTSAPTPTPTSGVSSSQSDAQDGTTGYASGSGVNASSSSSFSTERSSSVDSDADAGYNQATVTPAANSDKQSSADQQVASDTTSSPPSSSTGGDVEKANTQAESSSDSSPLIISVSVCGAAAVVAAVVVAVIYKKKKQLNERKAGDDDVGTRSFDLQRMSTPAENQAPGQRTDFAIL